MGTYTKRRLWSRDARHDPVELGVHLEVGVQLWSGAASEQPPAHGILSRHWRFSDLFSNLASKCGAPVVGVKPSVQRPGGHSRSKVGVDSTEHLAPGRHRP